jgi:hypothetical protein
MKRRHFHWDGGFCDTCHNNTNGCLLTPLMLQLRLLRVFLSSNKYFFKKTASPGMIHFFYYIGIGEEKKVEVRTLVGLIPGPQKIEVEAQQTAGPIHTPNYSPLLLLLTSHGAARSAPRRRS